MNVNENRTHMIENYIDEIRQSLVLLTNRVDRYGNVRPEWVFEYSKNSINMAIRQIEQYGSPDET